MFLHSLNCHEFDHIKTRASHFCKCQGVRDDLCSCRIFCGLGHFASVQKRKDVCILKIIVVPSVVGASCDSSACAQVMRFSNLMLLIRNRDLNALK